MRKFFIALALLLLPVPALAASTVYYGSLTVPTGGNITWGAGGTGCVLSTLGIFSVGNCPAGTAAFTAGSNITITGSNPYTIACPNCFQTTGGTVSGATTFASQLTLSGGATSSMAISIPNGAYAFISGASGSYTASGYWIGNGASTYSKLNTTSSTLCSGTVAGSGLALTVGSSLTTTIDSSGNLCTIGTIYYTSARKDKYDIHTAGIDGLRALAGADFNLAWKYRYPYGDPRQVHYGPMADNLPSYISGPHHDRIDLQALVVTEGVAIQQLASEVAVQRVALIALILWCCALTLAVVRGKGR